MTYGLPTFEKKAMWDTSKPWYERGLVTYGVNTALQVAAASGLAYISKSAQAVQTVKGAVNFGKSLQQLASWDSEDEKGFRLSRLSKKFGQGLSCAMSGARLYKGASGMMNDINQLLANEDNTVPETSSPCEGKNESESPSNENTAPETVPETSSPCEGGNESESQSSSSNEDVVPEPEPYKAIEPVPLWDKALCAVRKIGSIAVNFVGPTATINSIWNFEGMFHEDSTGYFTGHVTHNTIFDRDRSATVALTSSTTAYSGEKTGLDCTFDSTVNTYGDFTVGGQKFICNDYTVSTGGDLHEKDNLKVKVGGDARFVSKAKLFP